jgi:hypothetical protein
MASDDSFHTSEFGWVIALAPRWHRLEAEGPSGALALSSPVAFCGPDPDLGSLTWMIAAGPTDQELVAQFEAATIVPRTVGHQEAQTVATRIFPLIGQVTGAAVVELPDGSRALEVLEQFERSGGKQRRCGYQLICPLYGGPGKPVYFQRLCCYGSAEAFSLAIDQVRRMARSFHYIRPFSFPPA